MFVNKDETDILTDNTEKNKTNYWKYFYWTGQKSHFLTDFLTEQTQLMSALLLELQAQRYNENGFRAIAGGQSEVSRTFLYDFPTLVSK